LGKKLSEIVIRLLLCERKIFAMEKNSQIEETDYCQCGQKAGPYLIETKENTFLDLGKRIF
jgi:hypothetical protein